MIGKLRLCQEERERIIRELGRKDRHIAGDFTQEKSPRATTKHMEGNGFTQSNN